MQQIVIELTGKCNLRCKYCIYNDYNECDRNFNTENISFETAKKAIDYLYAHRNPDHFAVTFYGGEPLLNFDVLKKCIDYCLKNLDTKNLYFSLTTNLTLMTEEIAEYLAQVPNLDILLSLDGPQEINDECRVYANNKPTFNDAMRGLKVLAKAINKYKKTQTSFSCVLKPPYTKERFNKINDFFESLTFMPKGTNVMANYATAGTIPESYLKKLREENAPKDDSDFMNWIFDKGLEENFIDGERNIYSYMLQSCLIKIQNRRLLKKPINSHFHNGCCIPGFRGVYVCTDGSYKVCERIGDSPDIGNVDEGLNIDKINKYYIQDFEKKSYPKCSKCWALNLCDICYAECFDECGLNIKEKDSLCKGMLIRFKEWLSNYHSILETRPDLIEKLSKVETQ